MVFFVLLNLKFLESASLPRSIMWLITVFLGQGCIPPTDITLYLDKPYIKNSKIIPKTPISTIIKNTTLYDSKCETRNPKRDGIRKKWAEEIRGIKERVMSSSLPISNCNPHGYPQLVFFGFRLILQHPQESSNT